MSEQLRRYLAQQAELGGSEVVLTEKVLSAGVLSADEVLSAKVLSAQEQQEPRAGEVSVRAESTAPGTGHSALGRAKRKRGGDPESWKKGAPSIPGPGLVVGLPGASLVSDPMATLPTLEAVAGMVRECRRCPLCEGRTHAVPGEGEPGARLLLVGEGPGATEDETGRPFVGKAGALLNDILAAIGMRRETVFIANIVKCRPPQNRKPLPDEVAACLPYLHRQVELIRPTVIMALGGTAAESLLGVKKALGELRGKVHTLSGIPLVATYHPAALLRNPNWKKPTWDDVRIVRQLLDR